MKNIRTRAALKDSIHRLEEQQEMEWVQLKEQVEGTRELLKPINLLQNTAAKLLAFRKVNAGALAMAAGGFLLKKIVGRMLLGKGSNGTSV